MEGGKGGKVRERVEEKDGRMEGEKKRRREKKKRDT